MKRLCLFQSTRHEPVCKKLAGGRGERGRGKERARGRGRGRNRQETGAKDDVSIGSVPSVSQTFSENGTAQPDPQPARPPKQRGQGRGRGAKGDIDGKGRGRGNRAQNGAHPTDSVGAAVALPKASQNLPPGIIPIASQPAPSVADDSKATVSQAETRPSTSWPAATDDLPPLSSLSLSKPPGVFQPALDPLVNIGPDARLISADVTLLIDKQHANLQL